jgi:hypothetical protein
MPVPDLKPPTLRHGLAYQDLEWKVLYVGSAADQEHDQVLEEVDVGPVRVGTSNFVLSVSGHARARPSGTPPGRDTVAGPKHHPNRSHAMHTPWRQLHSPAAHSYSSAMH